MRTVISGAVSVSRLRPIDQQFRRRSLVFLAEVVAETVRDRLEHGEGSTSVCSCDASARPARSQPSLRGRPSSPLHQRPHSRPEQSGRPAKPSCHRTVRLVEFLLDRFQLRQHLGQFAGWFTSQSFCGARRMRAPLAPPRLSLPRKVEAEAQAVVTNWEMESPEARILAFNAAISCASISS
jgi:hypothetical protein